MFLPLIKEYGAAVIGISNDETGISEDPDERFRIAKKIVKRAEEGGEAGDEGGRRRRRIRSAARD
jgi:cobalamin-dependent methionine synthase I